MMKKIFYLLLIFFFVFLLSGCKEDLPKPDTSNDTPIEEPEEPKEPEVPIEEPEKPIKEKGCQAGMRLWYFLIPLALVFIRRKRY